MSGDGIVILPRAAGEGNRPPGPAFGRPEDRLRRWRGRIEGRGGVRPLHHASHGPPPPLRGGGPDRGFSLLELIVVLAIMALAAVALAPITGNASRGITIDAAARDIAVELRAARAAAIYANRETDFTIDAVARRYWSGAAPRPKSLPDGIAAAFAQGEGSRAMIRFFPDGSASGGRILLSGAGRAAAIEVDALTGRARIDVGR
jgi:general secretion pathway protein H